MNSKLCLAVEQAKKPSMPKDAGASLAAAFPEKTDEPPRISSVGPNRHLNVCVPGTYFFPQRTIASSTSPSALPFSVRV